MQQFVPQAALTPLRTRERDEEAVAALVYHICRARDPRERNLIMMDYVIKASRLDDATRTAFDRAVLTSFDPRVQWGDSSVRLPRAPGPKVRVVDAMVLTIQPVELGAAKAILGIGRRPAKTHKSRRYFETEIACDAAGLLDQPRMLRVGLTSVGQPLNIHSLAAVYEVAEVYQPAIWFLVGMAAGLEGSVRPGDVVVPETVWYYEPGRLMQDGVFEPRPDTASRGQLSNQMTQLAVSADAITRRVVELVEELPARETPADRPAHFEPQILCGKEALASGEKLLRDGKTLRKLHDVNQRIVGGDQESYGFAVACRATEWAVFRGIADYGGPSKDSRWQYVATAYAMATCRAFLEKVFIPADVAHSF
jgi:nucleoside phosphorylase